MNRSRVLLVDDSRVALEKLRDLYEDLGCDVVAAHRDGPSAIEAFRRQRADVDLVSLDLVLPGMDGLEVLAELKRIDPTVRVVIVSSVVQPEVEAHARRLGALGVLAKPCTSEQVRPLLGTA